MLLPKVAGHYLDTLRAAIRAAEKFRGSTTPNPPVGAAVLDEAGTVLAIGVHERPGEAHAEVAALSQLRELGAMARAHTLVVTLEPCNHTGKTSPCTEAIVKAGIRQVLFGCRDPNPNVAGGGAAFLKAKGLSVTAGVLENECHELARGFFSLIERGRPFVTLKIARDEKGSMIPPPGQKTFTSQESLTLAHEMRRASDAIVTGSGTVLGDDPEFTVRHVHDFEHKTRIVAVLDRRGRVPDAWFEKGALLRQERIRWTESPERLLAFLAKRQVQEVLIEAGPSVVDVFRDVGLVDEEVVFEKGPGSGSGGDRLQRRRFPSPRS